jgi:hypothetical protein
LNDPDTKPLIKNTRIAVVVAAVADQHQEENGGSGGGSGGCVEHVINSPAANYTYTVGGTAAVGSAGSSGAAGGAGAAGYIVVEEHYGS